MAELGNIHPDTYIKCAHCGYIFYDIYIENVDDDGIMNCYQCKGKVRLPQSMQEEIRKIKKSGQK
ncbi:MAG: hypothetical protein ABIH00_05560 [Armatimonadota bacterium]